MTMTSETATSTRAPLSDLTQDGQVLPPFVALDELDAELSRLDDWISNFIGRMQPYRSEQPVGLIEEKPDAPTGPEHSGLEQRILRCRVVVRGILRGLDSMNAGLRL